ncbi:hypothetical protein JAAARDRAFT_59474 [Jaapia argillacea MUCL 33604]|uniref:F-box domain-containing protein n=1 Tax=Jaapia argillacea MUCL 33604 TaxID=933084 RepID=A0A067Q0A0_9AGAM|nr:hypothetical protein JAAARDRAFT_59474 [Jaapia argillacea MUCL 33604]
MNTLDGLSPLSLTENLPNEILSDIFWQLTKMPPYTAERSLSSVLLVCRRWNVVAISTPDLWTTLTITSGNALRAEILLSRSKDVAVDVIIREVLHWGGGIVVIVELIRQHLHRIRNLSLFKTPSLLVSRILGRLCVPAPRLELFAIVDPDYPRNPERLLLPSSFLGEGAPQLKHLILEHSSIFWSSPLFHNLSTLYNTLENIHATPSSDLFLSVLQSCSQLERLHLNASGPILRHDAVLTRSNRRVRLPALRYLTLSFVTISQITYTLSHILSPSISDLHILTTAPDGWDLVNGIMPFLAEMCEASGASASNIEYISFAPTTEGEDMLLVLFLSSGGQLTLDVNNISPRKIFTSFASVSGAGWPLPKQLIVMLPRKETLAVSDWSIALRGWTGLESLILVSNCGEEYLVSALGSKEGSTSPSLEETYNNFISPSLGVLALKNSAAPDDNLAVRSEELISNLVMCLKQRQVQKLRLNILSLRGFIVAEADQKLLEGLVDRLLVLPPHDPVTVDPSRLRRYPPVLRGALRSVDCG